MLSDDGRPVHTAAVKKRRNDKIRIISNYEADITYINHGCGLHATDAHTLSLSGLSRPLQSYRRISYNWDQRITHEALQTKTRSTTVPQNKLERHIKNKKAVAMASLDALCASFFHLLFLSAVAIKDIYGCRIN